MSAIKLSLYSLLIFLSVGCIKDDFILDTIDPVIRITNPIDTIEINTSYQFAGTYLDNVGQSRNVPFTWESLNDDIMTITEEGLAFGQEKGSSTLVLSYQTDTLTVSDSILVHVGETTVVTPPSSIVGNIVTTSSYELKGDFELKQDGNDLILEFEDNYKASSALPGLYVYLSNNKNTVTSAIEIGKVEVFSGAHTYTIPDVNIADYGYLVYFCKPFNVKVGEGFIQ